MLKFMGMFDSLLIEMYDETESEMTKKYGRLTGRPCVESDNAFLARENSWKRNVKVYFDAPQMVVDNLRKLGVNVRENHIPQTVANNKYGVKKHKYVFSNLYWFWKFVEYGYRLGVNENIPIELHYMRQCLASMKPIEIVPIKHIESDNVVEEALMFLAS